MILLSKREGKKEEEASLLDSMSRTAEDGMIDGSHGTHEIWELCSLVSFVGRWGKRTYCFLTSTYGLRSFCLGSV